MPREGVLSPRLWCPDCDCYRQHDISGCPVAECRECGEPHDMTPEEIQPYRDRLISELVLRYHRQTEAYDRSVCTGIPRHGDAFPATDRERVLIERNARETYRRLRQVAYGFGIDSGEWQRVVRSGSHDLPALS